MGETADLTAQLAFKKHRLAACICHVSVSPRLIVLVMRAISPSRSRWLPARFQRGFASSTVGLDPANLPETPALGRIQHLYVLQPFWERHTRFPNQADGRSVAGRPNQQRCRSSHSLQEIGGTLQGPSGPYTSSILSGANSSELFSATNMGRLTACRASKMKHLCHCLPTSVTWRPHLSRAEIIP